MQRKKATGEQFISERIQPDPESFDARGTAFGEPALPLRFSWRGKTVEVEEILDTWKDTGPCSHGSGEKYVRKHWFRVRTTEGEEMRIYFDRQARSKRDLKARWWLYTHSPSKDRP
jgi:phosphoribosylglycinamide formyltransferase-1